MLAALGGLEHADCPVPSGLQSGYRLVAFLPDLTSLHLGSLLRSTMRLDECPKRKVTIYSLLNMAQCL